jgi:hypothetical protein
MQQAGALAGCLKPQQGPGSGIAIKGDAPADPALEHSVENLDLGHGPSDEGPDPVAVRRKGRQLDPGGHSSCAPNSV